MLTMSVLVNLRPQRRHLRQLLRHHMLQRPLRRRLLLLASRTRSSLPCLLEAVALVEAMGLRALGVVSTTSLKTALSPLLAPVVEEAEVAAEAVVVRVVLLLLGMNIGTTLAQNRTLQFGSGATTGTSLARRPIASPLPSLRAQ